MLLFSLRSTLADVREEAGGDVGDMLGVKPYASAIGGRRRRRAEVVEAERDPAVADVLRPPDRRAGFDRHARHRCGRTLERYASSCASKSFHDGIETTRRSRPLAQAVAPPRARGRPRSRSRSGSDPVRPSVDAGSEDVGTARDVGVALAQERQLLAREHDRRGPRLGLDRDFHASSVSSASAGRMSITFGVARSIASCSIG